jgi:hypothetical protein
MFAVAAAGIYHTTLVRTDENAIQQVTSKYSASLISDQSPKNDVIQMLSSHNEQELCKLLIAGMCNFGVTGDVPADEEPTIGDIQTIKGVIRFIAYAYVHINLHQPLSRMKILQAFACMTSLYQNTQDRWSASPFIEMRTKAHAINHVDKGCRAFFGNFNWGPNAQYVRRMFDLLMQDWPVVHTERFDVIIPWRPQDFENPNYNTIRCPRQVVDAVNMQLQDFTSDVTSLCKDMLRIIYDMWRHVPELSGRNNAQAVRDMINMFITIPWQGDSIITAVMLREALLVVAVEGFPQCSFDMEQQGVQEVRLNLRGERDIDNLPLKNLIEFLPIQIFASMLRVALDGDQDIWQAESARVREWAPRQIIDNRLAMMCGSDQFDMMIAYINNQRFQDQRYGQYPLPFDDMMIYAIRQSTSVELYEDTVKMMKARFGTTFIEAIRGLPDYRLSQIMFTQVRYNGQEQVILINIQPAGIVNDLSFMEEFFHRHPNYMHMASGGYAITCKTHSTGIDTCVNVYTGIAPPEHILDSVVIRMDNERVIPTIRNTNGVFEDAVGIWEISENAIITGLAPLMSRAINQIKNGQLHLIVRTPFYLYKEKFITPNSQYVTQIHDLIELTSGQGIPWPEFIRVLPAEEQVILPTVVTCFQPLVECNETTLATFPYAVTAPRNMDILPNEELFNQATHASRPFDNFLPQQLELYITDIRYKEKQLPLAMANLNYSPSPP